MSVVMEITNQRNINSHSIQLFPDVRNSLCCLHRVNRQTHHLRTSDRQLLDLNGGANHINSIRIGHGLNTDRRSTAHGKHPGAPDHTRLERMPQFGSGRLNRSQRLHYFTSKRATPFFDTCVKSRVLPRTCTSVTLERPTTTDSGRAPETARTSPPLIILRACTTRAPSITSIQDEACVLTTRIVPPAAAPEAFAKAAPAPELGTAVAGAVVAVLGINATP